MAFSKAESIGSSTGSGTGDGVSEDLSINGTVERGKIAAGVGDFLISFYKA